VPEQKLIVLHHSAMVEYSLTPWGRLFVEPLDMLGAWAKKNTEAVKSLTPRRNATPSQKGDKGKKRET